jgi:DNA repair exonuclease SbcCD nuclease subunit
MRLLCTSDWQTETDNLDLCETALGELLAYADKYQPDAIIFAGDLKQHYIHQNLIFVVKWWVKKIREMKNRGHRVILLKGNHDRLSQSVNSKDWMDILRAAGAETVSYPKVKEIGGRVAFLPYTPDREQEREWAQDLAKQGADALVFHTEILSADMGAVKGKGISLEDLGASRYKVCLGGHIHKHQKIGDNCYFIGSPFCHGWGEANMQHGFVLAEI